VKKSALVVCAAALVSASSSPARAHVGAAVAVAKFMKPADPMIMHGDPNDTVTPTPYVWVTADASYTVTWDDGDADPTGRFTFYYMDHQPTFQVASDDIKTTGTIIDDAVNLAGGYFSSCYCEGDQGVTCPVIVRDPAGNCGNQIVWNTSGIAPGSYWVVAVNDDPPFHVAYATNVPIRVAHGGAPLPAINVVRPDGYGAWDTSYHLQWLADGKAPLSFDLAYGLEDTTTALTPQAQIFAGTAIAPNSDGTFSYDWDVSKLDNNKSYWVRITVTDADGKSAFTDSHYGVTVFHSGMMAPADMAMAPPKKSGCEIGPDGGGDGARSRGLVLLFVLAALATTIYVARRAARRTG
jgi:hypothetical protein